MERPEIAANGEQISRRQASISAEGTKKVERLAGQSKRLVEDVKSWVDLKIKYTKLEVLEYFEEKKNEFVESLEPLKKDVMVGAVAALFAVIGMVFLFTSAALFIGTWLGHPGWGYLIMTGVLFVLAAMLVYFQFGRKGKSGDRVEASTQQLTDDSGQKQLTGDTERKQLASGSTGA